MDMERLKAMASALIAEDNRHLAELAKLYDQFSDVVPPGMVAEVEEASKTYTPEKLSGLKGEIMEDGLRSLLAMTLGR